MLHTQLIEVAEGLPGEVADLRIVAFGFKLADDHHRQNDGMLGEPEDRTRIGEENRGVQYVRALSLFGR